ncbi:hypothetical protein FQN55_001736 [Onygenales sp. PD_40]|nr:hypothetical protein FQN55_001736 [Onygenales sp. PD_40]KAK2793222.1 hypothetical protein FQN52_001870 [Onygenales sp. PD_12]
MQLSVAIVSVFAAIAAAVTPPDTSKPPSGNPISLPGLGDIVPVGEPYTITWTPTTKGKVSILLLRGPSDNVVPIDTLADSISNAGTFAWTPSTSLEGDTTGYGLQIIVEGTGEYQYSTQFGIKNSNPKPPTSGTPTATPSNDPTSSSGYPTSEPTSETTKTYSATTLTTTSKATTTTTTSSVETPTPEPTTSAPGTVTPPATTPTPTPSGFPGAAGRNGVALSGAVIAAAAAIFAF